MGVMIGSNKLKGCRAGNKKVKKIMRGNQKIWSAGNIVTYHVDTGTTYQEEVDEGASCLSPKTFTPQKSGWTFVGWREDAEANGAVLSSKIMADSPVTFYAIFQQTITLSYAGNGNTGGSTAEQTGTRYYNNGNTADPSFLLSANGFIKTNYTFAKWALGSADGSQYLVGTTITLSESTTMYAVWVATVTNFAYNGAVQMFKAPATGKYRLYCKGAKGSSGDAAQWYGKRGGEGGTATGVILLNKDDVVYIGVGGAGKAATKNAGVAGGFNGGGFTGRLGEFTAKGSGGGCTHMAFANGALSSLSGQKDKVILVAGGGGGGGCYGFTANGVFNSVNMRGGGGGGNTGSDGLSDIPNYGQQVGRGGTQNSGGYNGGGFGYGGSAPDTNVEGCGGGGGWYGGGCGGNYNGPSGGGGGSGYVNANYLTETSMTNGGNNENVTLYNGSASITFIEPT